LQHHFGVELSEGIFNIKLILKTKKKESVVIPKDYDNDPKIDKRKFEIKSIPLNDQGISYGTVNFYLYKTNKSYNDDFKKPFLIVSGRPLGNSFISDIPELEQYSAIWSSHYVTGCVVCNSVKPNQSRIGLDSTPAKTLFLRAMNSASIDLKRELSIWKTDLAAAEDKDLGDQVILKVTKFLQKKGVKFSFRNPIHKGLANKLNQPGDINEDERISNTPDGNNEGRIVKDGDELVDILYKPEIREPHPPDPPGPEPPEEIEVTITTPENDGRKVRTVRIKRSLLSKGGRKIRKSYSGPDLQFDADEDDLMMLSYFEADPPRVMINTVHPAWKKLQKKLTDQTDSKKFTELKEKLMTERYMWEVLKNGLENKKELTSEQIDNMFWTYFHELTDIS